MSKRKNKLENTIKARAEKARKEYAKERKERLNRLAREAIEEREDLFSTPAAQPKDMVNNPSHYGGEENPYETIKIAEAKLTNEEFIGAMKFEVMCYNDRHRRKNGFEDLRKALWYQTRLVDYIQRNCLEASVGP